MLRPCTILCKNPNVSAGSDMKNLQPSWRTSLSPNFAGSLKSSFQSSWFGPSEGMKLDKKLTAACHSCTSAPATLCARTFSRNCVSSRLGRLSATGLQGSPDATDRTLRKEDSAQHGVSSLPLHAQIMACSLHSGGEGVPKADSRVCLPTFIGQILLLYAREH